MNMDTLISILSDIIECDPGIGKHICDHTCTNTLRSFICGCNSAFHLDDDGTTCIGIY